MRDLVTERTMQKQKSNLYFSPRRRAKITYKIRESA